MHNTALIVAAAGQGSRMGAQMNKQFIEIGGKPILIHTLKRFEELEAIGQVILLHHGNEKNDMHALIKAAQLSIEIDYVEGGITRQASIFNGLCALKSHIDKVIIHDGARPFVSQEMMDEMASFLKQLSMADNHEGAFFGVPLKDTIKQKTESGFETIDRSSLYAVQTPQIFKKDPLLKAHASASDEGFVGTDDCSLIERNGGHIVVLPGDYKNIKVTTPEDLLIAEVFLK